MYSVSASKLNYCLCQIYYTFFTLKVKEQTKPYVRFISRNEITFENSACVVRQKTISNSINATISITGVDN